MRDILATYLDDHLAGSVHAIELLKTMRDDHKNEPLGEFAGKLIPEIEADRQQLLRLVERIGAGGSEMKQLAGWVGEKIGRIKLSHRVTNSLSTFEALEFLELGIHGKWALWRALAEVSPAEPRLQGVDFQRLIRRADAQHSQVEEFRLELAHTVFIGAALKSMRERSQGARANGYQ
jgi:hypothetical protein